MAMDPKLTDKVDFVEEKNGKTIYDLPAAKKQHQVIRDIGKEEEKDEIEDQETSITIKEGKPEAPENKKKVALGESAAAKAKKDEKDKFENAILVVATLIITLTYQALLSPPSTLSKEGTEIDWGCLGKNQGRGLVKGMKECPAGLTFAFLFINTLVFLTSILILALTFRRRRVLLLNPFGFLLGGLTVFLTVNYCILLMAFSYYIAYVAIPLCGVAFFGFTGIIGSRGSNPILASAQLEAATQRKMDETKLRRIIRKLETRTTEEGNEGTKALRELLAATEAEKDYVKEIKEFENAMLVGVTLIITLTYQALLNPPSSLFKEGTEIDWGCLGKNAGRGLVKGMKECPAGLAFAFLFINTLVFLESILLLLFTLRGCAGLLLGALITFLIACYSILLMAFSYNTAYVAIPLCFVAFLLCLSSQMGWASTD